MNVSEAIAVRRSIRKYDPRPIEPEKLRQVLEAGRLAPSGSNRQEWRFIVVTDPELRKRLAAACHNQQMVAEAPADLVVCATAVSEMMCGQRSDGVNGSIALSFMMLQATELGLGTCWLGAFSNEHVQQVLGITDAVVAVSPIGYPAESPSPRPRKAFDEVVSFR